MRTVESIPLVAADLSDLPADGSVWCRWPWGHETAMVRRLDGRRYVAVIPFLYTHAVVWGLIDDCQFVFTDRWCFHDSTAALIAATVWDGEPGTEPTGWHRHPRSGRRRDAEGNEWVAP